MRPYEVMVIFDAELDEDEVRSSVARSTDLIVSKGANLGQVDFWGKRRFAYELKHRWEGYYVVFQAKAEPEAMDELHRTLSLADAVLRHKILRIPEQVYGNLGGNTPPPAPQAETLAADAPEADAVEVDVPVVEIDVEVEEVVETTDAPDDDATPAAAPVSSDD